MNYQPPPQQDLVEQIRRGLEPHMAQLQGDPALQGMGFWFVLIKLVLFVLLLTAISYATWWPLKKITHAKDWLLDTKHKVEIPADLASAVDPEEARLLATLHYELRKVDVLRGTLASHEAGPIVEQIKAAEKNYKEGK